MNANQEVNHVTKWLSYNLLKYVKMYYARHFVEKMSSYDIQMVNDRGLVILEIFMTYLCFNLKY